MDETAFTIVVPDNVVEQVNAYRLPDQSMQDVILQSLNTYLTLEENHQNRTDSTASPIRLEFLNLDAP